MTPAYAQSFLAVCFDAGLSKEAAAELLQKESVDLEKVKRPAFAEGYSKAAAEVPGGLQPLLFIEKEANARGLGLVGQSLWGLLKGTAQASKTPFSAANKVRSKVWGNNPNSFVRSRPLTTAIGTGLLGTGLGVGGYKLMGGGNSGYNDDFSDFGIGGSHSGSQNEARYKDSLYNVYGPNIAASNKIMSDSFKEEQELEKALSDGTGGPDAYRRLTELKRAKKDERIKRNRLTENLTASEARHQQALEQVRKQQEGLESRRTSVMGLPRRMWERVRGRDPENYYDEQIAQLHGQAQANTRGSRMAEDRLRLLDSGYRGRSPVKAPKTPNYEKTVFAPYGE